MSAPVVARTAAELAAAVLRVGAELPPRLVPTMGALHRGHASLIESAAASPRAPVVASVFVNPTQFGPGEDFERYPRTLDADLAVCGAAGADVVFVPSAAAMYPDGFVTTVRVRGPLTETLEGAHRPGHFDGVATVVLKLLNVVRPGAVLLGEKDFQQLAVVRRVIADLNVPCAVAARPTVREPDGLALSSRNRYLSPAERATAAGLPAALFAARDAVEAGAAPAAVARRFADRLSAAGFAVDYAVVRDAATLGPPGDARALRVLVAAKLGNTRLIDNVAAVRPA